MASTQNTKNLNSGIAIGIAISAVRYLINKNILKNSNTPDNIRAVIQNWINTVCRHNPQDIVSLYAPDGVLLGTVAKSMKVGRKQILSYFEMFVGKEPCGYITDINVQNFGSDYAVADGTYNFELTNEEGGRDMVPARFTFVLKRVVGGPNTPNRGGWVIASHHSSAQPE